MKLNYSKRTLKKPLPLDYGGYLKWKLYFRSNKNGLYIKSQPVYIRFLKTLIMGLVCSLCILFVTFGTNWELTTSIVLFNWLVYTFIIIRFYREGKAYLEYLHQVKQYNKTFKQIILSSPDYEEFIKACKHHHLID